MDRGRLMEKIPVPKIDYEAIQRKHAIKTWGVSCLDGPRTLDSSRNQGLALYLVRRSHREQSPELNELEELLKQEEV